MANISNPRNQNEPLLGGDDDRKEAILFGGYSIGTSEEARQETFFGMLSSLICSYYRKKSFTSAIIILSIFVYILTIFYGTETGKFLQPTPEALSFYGSKSNALIKKGEIWRLLTPVLLHSSLPHLTYNILMILILLSRVEYAMGRKTSILIYFISGIGGNLLSALANPDAISVGASTAIFGVLGSMIGWILLNWEFLRGNPKRNVGILLLVMFVIFNLIMGYTTTDIDNWGHFGGVLTGIALGICLVSPLAAATKREKTMRFGSLAFLIIFLIGGTIILYLK